MIVGAVIGLTILLVLCVCGAVARVTYDRMSPRERELERIKETQVYKARVALKDAKRGGPRKNAVQVRAEAWQAEQARTETLRAARMRLPAGKVLVTDQERDAAVAELVRAHEVGALDAAEFDDRMSRAHQAKTRGQLSGLLADLP